MEYKKFNHTYVVRMDKGEEVLTSLKELCQKENITLGSISAIGATDEVEIGIFDTNTKVYHSSTLKEPFEITSLSGNITTKEGEVYLHLHITVADKVHQVYGGHLNRCVISATCEMIITVLDGTVERVLDPVIGLNLLQYENR